jgi:hypothetical protein
LAGRPPSRASSLPQVNGYIWERLVGWQVSIESRLAPTVGLGTSGRDWLAVRPPSLAGQLPQLDWVHLGEIGWLAGRLRWQARSHSWVGCIRERLVGWRAVFAGRLAPTVGLGASGRDWLAVRPPSRASSLPQGDWVHLGEIGWLSGRHRWQASSRSWIGCIWERLVGWQAVFAGKPGPTVGSGASGRDWLAGGPSSLAGQLPQLDWVHLGEIGWLSGRHREQARSHRGLGASGRDWSADRPPSPAGQLPQWTGVYPARSSPLNRPSVSSPAALDLDLAFDLPAPSAG